MASGRGGSPGAARRRGRGRAGLTGRTPAGRPGLRIGRVARERAGAAAAARPRLTGRAAVLVLVVALLMVSYASSLRAYLDQRQHIGSLEAGIASSEQRISALREEKRRWRDKAYVVAQARARFAFGFPGEIGYQVLDEDGKPLDHQDSLSAPPARPDETPEWWEATLDSIEAAGNPTPTPQPAAKITAPSDGAPTARDR